MAVQARPEPHDAPAPTVHEMLVCVQQGHMTLEKAIARLARALELAAMPADLRGPFRLGPSAGPAGGPLYSVTDECGYASPSIGVINPNSVPIYLGIGGDTPRPGQGAVSVPPNSLIVLPVSATDLELGADSSDFTTENAVFHVLRFHTVQPASLGSA